MKKAKLTSLGQGRSHFVLSGIDVASRPAALSPQGTECLNQHLRRHTGGRSEREEGQVEAAHKGTMPSNSAATSATLGSCKRVWSSEGAYCYLTLPQRCVPKSLNIFLTIVFLQI